MSYYIVFDKTSRLVQRSGQCLEDDLADQARDASEEVMEATEEQVLALRQRGDWTISPEGVIAARVKPLDELKAELWKAVKLKRDRLISAGCAVPGIGVFQTDEKSMANIHEAVTGALLAGATGQPYTIDFTLADNSRPELNAVQMMLAGKVVGERKSAIHAYSQDVLRPLIQAAADEAELDAIDIETGWPA